MFDVRQCDLRKLNSMTKYPSIETYHTLGQKGRLTDERNVDFTGEEIFITEKVDGTNGRIVLLPDGTYILGSREDLLYARGDLIIRPKESIVTTLKPLADRIIECHSREADSQRIVVLFLEVYGGKIGGAAKQYATDGRTGCRLFDVVDLADATPIFERSCEQIALWRQAAGQPFVAESEMARWGEQYDIPRTPRLTTDLAVPTEIESTLEFLQRVIPASQVKLDKTAGGRAEGVVIRTTDRSKIAKLRYEDYERTLRARK